ncbi:MAG: DUF4304 domain-containing protein [Pyrinomonadaceae bacterium]
MTEKSKYVLALDEVQGKVYEFMKPLGFRKKGRTFNREADESGIFQVVQFQTGPYELAPEIPSFRLNLYGKFTVNIGVLIKELYDFEEWHKPTNFYQEVYCQVRNRLPHLLYKKDVWWDLTSEVDQTSTIVIDGFESVGFDYFALYDTRVKFRENYGRFDDAPPRAKLDVALMVLHHDRIEGERLFREYYEQTDRSHGHFKYLQDLADRLGFE